MPTAHGAPTAAVDLDIQGMTCASCAARIEKRLNRLEGVSATVNYATERAHADLPPGVDADKLIAEIRRTGYDASIPHPEADDDARAAAAARGLRTRLLVAATLAIPVIALSMVPAWQFPAWQWVSLALALPVVTWAAWPFHRAAVVNLRHGSVTMDTLISLGVTVATLWSLYALLFTPAGMIGMTHGFEWFASSEPAVYLEVAAGVTMFLLAGRYAEVRATRRAGAALRTLMELGAKDAAVLRDGAEVRVPIASLRVGDEFIVRPGEKVATDGIVVSGDSGIDTALVTGESVPVDVSAGDDVVGATLNVGGRIVVRATRVGADTQLAQMTRLVEQAQSRKADVQRLADRVSAVFVPVVIAVALATLVTWLVFGGSVQAAFTAAVAVLIIACPCALGLATPTALMVGTGRGAQLGILITGPEVLESTRTVDTIALDKTGTVTSGRMTVTDVTPTPGTDADEVLRAAGAVEDASEHPLARAISSAARARFGTLPTVEAFTGTAGTGVAGVVDGRRVLVGRDALLRAWGIDAPAGGGPDRTTVLVAWDGEVRGTITLEDTVKATSAEAVSRLRALGLEPMLLTGDGEQVARRVAAQVGIDLVVAEVLPHDKVAAIRAQQEQGRTVAMVGDGVNDAAALAQADLGIAMGTGTDAAIAASDLTLVRGDLLAAVDALRLSRATLRTIKTNLFWAFAYNTAAIPLAALGLLNPMIAGAAMAFSSVFVVGNSLLLRRFRSTVPEELR
ncbi:heavy metal translocating P-type ATPase [Microbacterium sp. SSW1-59]|uniref:heavy metal translocating P-type ATPase n=1 Tax=Microbacterium xanthum TaxID=3079794 RepID=UPI002AD35B60|nr:heavy metal translocating P-type ATPase [Microbacterium sp. SSW1-59]MDZ8201383.1 heavy metal translocating P-type ATPase [Microbacterium sp. SSW1-59]